MWWSVFEKGFRTLARLEILDGDSTETGKPNGINQLKRNQSLHGPEEQRRPKGTGRNEVEKLLGFGLQRDVSRGSAHVRVAGMEVSTRNEIGWPLTVGSQGRHPPPHPAPPCFKGSWESCK